MKLNSMIFVASILVIIFMVVIFNQWQETKDSLKFYQEGYENLVKNNGAFIILKYIDDKKGGVECKEEKVEIAPLHTWEFNFDKDTPIYRIVIMRGQNEP